MRTFIHMLILLSFFRDEAWALPEIRMLNAVVTIPGEVPVLSKVSGEAELIWDALLTPEEFEAAKDRAVLVRFPDHWSNLAAAGVKPQGQATYRWIVQLPESALGQPLGIWLPRSLGPATIWVNKRKVIEHDFGPEGTDIWDRSPGHNRIFMTPHSTQLEFVVQSFNRHLHTGGFVDRFLIGPAADIRQTARTLMAFDFLVFGLLVFSAIYHLWLYTFRRKFAAYRDLGLFFLIVVVRILCTGSSHWFSELGLNEILISKIGWISFYSCLPIGMQLLRSIFPADAPSLFVKIVKVVSYTAIAVVVLTPASFAVLLILPMQIFTVLIVFPVMWILFRAYLNRRPGTLMLLPASAMLLLMSMVEIYNNINRIDQNFSLLGIGVLLFSLGASVSQSLNFDRTFHMVERQTRGIDSLNRKLRKQAEILERRIHQTTEEMRTLLHNLPEGVLLIQEQDGRLEVGIYLSQSIQRILGTETITWPLVQDFLAQTNLDSDQRAQLEATLKAMLGSDAISYELNADNLPQELRRVDDGASQTFLCAWAPVILDGLIHSVLLVLVDVSSERSVYHQLERDQEIFDRMVQLLASDAENLGIFMQEAQEIMQRIEAALPAADRRQERLLRELHTLKGLARSFGLLTLARTAHDMEDRLLRQPMSRLDPLLAIWKSHHEALTTLGFTVRNQPARERDEDLLLVCGQEILNHPEPPGEVWLQGWQAYVQSIFVRADILIGSLEEGLVSVAAQLDKPNPVLIIEGGEIGIRQSVQGKLLGGLNHILRNALDHGIEPADERRRLGKAERGTITIKVHYREKFVMEVHDDGRGLNLARIHQRALEQGLIRADQNPDDEDIARMVFAPGFSTKSAINDISGRGIGMDAVQTAIQQMGGQIRIVWRSRRTEQGFREGMWCIILPRRYGFHEVPS